MSDILLNNFFGEEMQKYKPKFELGKVYSDPRVNAFTQVKDLNSALPQIQNNSSNTNTESVNNV